jgi:hypothetical protein
VADERNRASTKLQDILFTGEQLRDPCRYLLSGKPKPNFVDVGVHFGCFQVDLDTVSALGASKAYKPGSELHIADRPLAANSSQFL